MGEKCPVYVVTGDAPVRRQLVRLLRTRGYRTTPFANGRDFGDALHYLAPGIAIIDLQIGDMSGLTLLEKLVFSRRDVPAIAASTQVDIKTAVDAIKGGAEDFAEKPFVENLLMEMLDSIASRLDERIEAESRRKMVSSCLDRLTRREAEVMAALKENDDNFQAAHELRLSIRTIEAYRARIIKKLGVRRFSEALLLCMQSESTDRAIPR